jgi:hypothetical protein
VGEAREPHLPCGVISKKLIGERMRARKDASWSFLLERTGDEDRGRAGQTAFLASRERRRQHSPAQKAQSRSEAVMLRSELERPAIP